MRVRAIVIRIIRQFFRDKRTLGLMILAPMFVLFLMNLVFNGEEYKPTIAVDQAVPVALAEKLQKNDAHIKWMGKQTAKAQLNKQQIDAFIEMKEGMPQMTLEGSDPTANKAVLMSVQKTLQQLTPQTKTMKLDTIYLHGSEEMALFDNFGPVLIGFFIFFFVFLIAGVSFFTRTDERNIRASVGNAVKTMGDCGWLCDRFWHFHHISSQLDFVVCDSCA